MSSHKEAQTFEQAKEVYLAPTSARQRLGMLFDGGVFTELDPYSSVDGQPCGVVCGYGAANGRYLCAFAQEGGGMGKMQAAKISKLLDLALKTGVPVVGMYDSLGARVSEGVAALEAYGEVLLRINNLSGVVPQIAVVLGGCTGASAMLACSADFVVMGKNATFFMTPPALAENEVENAGSCENAAKAGVAHLLAETDRQAGEYVRRLLSFLPLNNLSPCLPLAHKAPESKESHDYGNLDPAYQAQSIMDAGSLLELMGGFGGSAYTAFGTLGGAPVCVVGTKDKLNADGCAKIAKMASVCDAFQVPIITLVNCSGFVPCAKAELCGSVRGMARLGHVYAEATTAKAAVITGKAYGAAYIALAGRAANCDYTIAWPTATISTLEPQAAVALLHADEISAQRSREDILRDYLAGAANPLTAAKAGYLDDVVSPEQTRAALLGAMDLLSAKRVQKNPKKHSNLPM